MSVQDKDRTQTAIATHTHNFEKWFSQKFSPLCDRTTLGLWNQKTIVKVCNSFDWLNCAYFEPDNCN